MNHNALFRRAVNNDLRLQGALAFGKCPHEIFAFYHRCKLGFLLRMAAKIFRLLVISDSLATVDFGRFPPYFIWGWWRWGRVGRAACSCVLWTVPNSILKSDVNIDSFMCRLPNGQWSNNWTYCNTPCKCRYLYLMIGISVTVVGNTVFDLKKYVQIPYSPHI